VSLSIHKLETGFRLRYGDEKRHIDVFIDTQKGDVVIHSIRNVRVILESPEEKVEPAVGRFAEANELTHMRLFSKLKNVIKNEVLQALRDRGCTSRERAFTLDAILEIAQMEASSYPAINKALKHYGISGTKQRLALVLASLRRRGLIGEVIVSAGNEHIKKYYVVGEHHETPSSIR